MASSSLMTPLTTSTAAEPSPNSFPSDPSFQYPTSSSGETSSGPSATSSKDFGMTAHATSLGLPSSFTSSPGETSALVTAGASSIIATSTSPVTTSSTSAVRSSAANSSSYSFLPEPTTNSYSSTVHLFPGLTTSSYITMSAVPVFSMSPTATMLPPSSSPSPSPSPSLTSPPPTTQPTPPYHVFIAAGAGGGAVLICVCLVVCLIGCITCKTGCKTRKFKRLFIRNRRNTEYMHRDEFWAGASQLQGPKVPQKEEQNVLHRNGTIKDVENQGRHLSPVWSGNQGGGSVEGVDGGSNLRVQDGGREENQSNWTLEPPAKETETTFITEQVPPLSATFNVGTQPSLLTQSCSPPQAPVVMPTEVPVTAGERTDSVSYVNVQHGSGRGVKHSTSDPQRMMDVKKKPVPIPRPSGSPNDSVGYVNARQSPNSHHPQTMPRDRSDGYTQVLIHDGQAPVFVPNESCYDVPRSLAAAQSGPLPQAGVGTILPSQAFRPEVNSALHNAGVAQPDSSHYDIPSGNAPKKPGKVPPFVAPKPQASSGHNNSLYDCPKSTPAQMSPAANLSGGVPFGGQFQDRGFHGGGGGGDTSMYDSPRSHLLAQRDGSSGLYDAPKLHSPIVQYHNTSSPSALSPRQESQYDVPNSPFRPRHGNGNLDVTAVYDTLAQHPPAGVPPPMQLQQHTGFAPAQHHSPIAGGQQPTMFRLPPVPQLTVHPTSHTPSDTSHYDVPRSPHRQGL